MKPTVNTTSTSTGTRTSTSTSTITGTSNQDENPNPKMYVRLILFFYLDCALVPFFFLLLGRVLRAPQALASFLKWTRLLHANNKAWIFIKLHKNVSVLIWSAML